MVPQIWRSPSTCGFDGDGELVAAFEKYGAFAESAESDLRALKVGEDADAAAGFFGGLADPVDIAASWSA